MFVSFKCQSIFRERLASCPICGDKLVPAKTTDDFLKKFLQIDSKTLKRFQTIRAQTIIEAKKSLAKSGPLKALGISGSARSEFGRAAESSNSEYLLAQALNKLKKLGAKTEMLKLREFNIKPCQACYSTTNTQCHCPCSCYPRGTAAGDDMSNKIYDKLLSADILILATPVNNMKISSYMALFLDRCISLDGSLLPADPKETKNKALNIKQTKFIELTADQKIPGSGFYRRFAGKVAGIIVTGHEAGAALTISSLFMVMNHWGAALAPWSNVYAMSSIEHATYEDKPLVTGPMSVDEVRIMAANSFLLAKKLKTKGGRFEYDYSSN